MNMQTRSREAEPPKAQTLPEGQAATSASGTGRSPQDLAERAELAGRLKAVMEDRRWTIAEAARRMGRSDGGLNQWLSGKYAGRIDTINQHVAQFLDTLESQNELEALMPPSPGYIETGFSSKVWNAILLAQTLPALTLVCAEAGMGKTMTANEFAARDRHATLVTMSPKAGTLQGALNQVMAALGIHQPNPGRQVATIGDRLKATSAKKVLIVDEAQNLSDQAINQLRHFVDLYRCGIALIGNSETSGRFTLWGEAAASAAGGRRNTQLRSRVAMKVLEAEPSAADIHLFLDAWAINDPDQRRFLAAVGRKPGALREIDYTIRLASLIAAGSGRPLTLADLKAAYENRGTGA